MKIDRRKPRHWLYLLLMGLNVVAAIVLRPLLHRRRSGKVLLYGHKRNGNLLAIHEWVLQHRPQGLDLYYLTMDPAYYQQLRREGVPCVLAIAPSAIGWLATADAIVSDHGLHAMRFMLGTTDMKFFDVWHGIPFKGFDADDFRLQHRYNEVWVASGLMEQLYVEKFGFSPHRVKVTGYARTDVLAGSGRNNQGQVRHRIGVPRGGKVVLFAPTWAQDDKGRSLFPFGVQADEFRAVMSALAQRENATIILRMHLNSGAVGGWAGDWPGLLSLPHTDWPNTEEILLAADILVCDWSSIAFDYLVLERPTIFLDVPAPFAKGFSLDASYRFGAVAGSMAETVELVEGYLRDPAEYARTFGDRSKRIKRLVHGDSADGAAASRCVERLGAALAYEHASIHG